MQRELYVAVVLLATCVPLATGADVAEDSLDGTWLPVNAELAGEKFPDEVRKAIKLVISGDQYFATVGSKQDRGTCKRDTASNPKTLDITGIEGPNKDRTILAIYERKADTLRVCYDLSGQNRPTEFKTAQGTALFLVEYELQKP